MASFRVVQTTPAADGSYKQLRVEDALAYLDKVCFNISKGVLPRWACPGAWYKFGNQPFLSSPHRPLLQVKQQFGNKPQIYNKFLEIMKAFKAQK